MNRIVVTCSLGLVALGLMMAGCQKPRVTLREQPTTRESSEVDLRGVDPLEFPEDLVVVPQVSPQSGAIGGDRISVATPDSTQTADDTLSNAGAAFLNSQATQVYRIQLVTADVYGEARAAAVVAEEIFDQPVFTDYEVPYFKVRVGRFVDRQAAEAYQKKAIAVGYKNAWVVLVNVHVRKAPLLYEELPDSLRREEVPDSTASPDDES